jgi:hypothetical protein
MHSEGVWECFIGRYIPLDLCWNRRAALDGIQLGHRSFGYIFLSAGHHLGTIYKRSLRVEPGVGGCGNSALLLDKQSIV